MNLNLSQIIDTLRAEQPAHVHNGRPTGKCCKYCSTYLAVVAEEPTIVHVQDPISQTVSVKCFYHGKFYCRMCHRYQV
jgi:hypothetical protein